MHQTTLHPPVYSYQLPPANNSSERLFKLGAMPNPDYLWKSLDLDKPLQKLGPVRESNPKTKALKIQNTPLRLAPLIATRPHYGAWTAHSSPTVLMRNRPVKETYPHHLPLSIYNVATSCCWQRFLLAFWSVNLAGFRENVTAFK